MQSNRESISARVTNCLSASQDTSLNALYHRLGIERSGDAQLRVRKTLRRLIGTGYVRRVRRGVYILIAAVPVEGASEYVEASIIEFLTECGGQAKTCDIHYAVWNWSGSRERSAEYYLVHRVLRESSMFERVQHGMWQLATEARTPKH